MSNQPSKSKDLNFRLKFIAYCWATLPPKEAGVTQQDFAKFAQFYLCHKTGRLMKDPIWKEYTREEILIEYFAYMMVEDPQFKMTFEAALGAKDEVLAAQVDEFLEFVEKMDKKEEEALTVKAQELPDSVSFKPQKD